MIIGYTPSFFRQYNRLPPALQLEADEKVRLFQDEKNHKALHVHKLKGTLQDQYSFRVNYKIRIIFWYTDTKPKEAILIAIGDHDVYNP